jgi:hypothetical protein
VIAGPAVDQLAAEYAGQPVLFLEQDVDNTVGMRYGRWWAAFGGTSAVLPMAMVSSGHQVADGSIAFPDPTMLKYYQAYRTMVEAESIRPALATIEVYDRRVGDRIQATVFVTNMGSQTLSANDNGAMVEVVVYEENHTLLTGRFVRAAVSRIIYPSIGPGETIAFIMETGDLIGVDWSRIHVLALADYRPAGNAGPYDMLQAAAALPPDFRILPEELLFLIDPAGPTADLSVSLGLRGPGHLTWAASENLPWLDVTPDSAPLLDMPEASVIPAALSSGWQQGMVNFTASGDGMSFSKQLPVRVYYGPVAHVYLPNITR